MLLFNWKQVLRESRRSNAELLKIMTYLTFKPKIYSKYDMYYKYSTVNWSGSSFLRNPKPLFIHRKSFPDKQIVEYIGLASLRNYPEYVMQGILTLDLLACSRKEDLINNNRLLSIENGEIHFLYEEAQEGDKEWH